jgi:hypothetical protein
MRKGDLRRFRGLDRLASHFSPLWEAVAGRTLWRCREVDSPYGSQWHRDSSCLSAERIVHTGAQEMGVGGG